MKFPLTRILSFAAWCACLIFLVVLSIRPTMPLKDLMLFANSDKLYHGLYYGIMTVGSRGFLNSQWQRVIAGFFLVFLGILLEFAQGAVPGRAFSVADMLANTTGVLIGISLLAKMDKHGIR